MEVWGSYNVFFFIIKKILKVKILFLSLKPTDSIESVTTFSEITKLL